MSTALLNRCTVYRLRNPNPLSCYLEPKRSRHQSRQQNTLGQNCGQVGIPRTENEPVGAISVRLPGQCFTCAIIFRHALPQSRLDFAQSDMRIVGQRYNFARDVFPLAL